MYIVHTNNVRSCFKVTLAIRFSLIYRGDSPKTYSLCDLGSHTEGQTERERQTERRRENGTDRQRDRYIYYAMYIDWTDQEYTHYVGSVTPSFHTNLKYPVSL